MKTKLNSGRQVSETGKLTDYTSYRLSIGEWLKYGLTGLLLAAIAGYIFYRSTVVGVALSPLAVLYPLYKRHDCKRERDAKLLSQFREGISTLSSSLAAGYSLENAMKEAESEMSLLYGPDSMIVKEFAYINHRTGMNVPVETAWEEFSFRSGLEDIKNFAAVMKVAKKTGGDMTEIITHSADVIGDKIRTEEEIKTMTAGKRFEQKIMNFIPVLIILYIDFTSPGFFDVMYETGTGRIIMTACLVVYIAAILLSRKILSIEV